MNTFDGPELLDAELARRLSECEEHLRAVVSDYRALTRTALFGALDPDLRSQIATAIRSYVSRGSERLQTAKAGIDAIRSLGSARALADDPLAGLAPSNDATASADPPPAVSRLREPQDQSRRAPEPPADEPDEPDGEQWTALGEAVTAPPPQAEAPPLAARPLAGAIEGRPKPRSTRGSAAPVRGDAFRRSDARERPAAPGQTARTAARRHKSGADIRPVSQEEMLTGARPGEADPGAGGDGAMSPNRPTSPDALFDATVKRVKEDQRRSIAAKGAATAVKLAGVVLREAEMIDELGQTVGRASTVLMEGNLLTAEQVEVFLDSLEGLDQSAEDPAAVLHTILKARSAFRFQGPDEGGPAIRAMISYANACAFADDDPGVLVLQNVGLARR